MDTAAQLTQAGRPDIWKQVLNNISAGTKLVGGVIKHDIVKSLDKVTGHVNKGIHAVQTKINGGLNKMRTTLGHGLDRVNNTLNQLQAEGKVPAVWHIKKFPTHAPPDRSWRVDIGTLAPVSTWIHRDETLKSRPAHRSQKRVPLAFGSRLVSLFRSWNSPGSLCTMGLFGVLVSLFSLTSFRSCAVVRRTLGSYARITVSRPAAAMRSSREFDGAFTARDSVEHLIEAGDAGPLDSTSRSQLLEVE